MKLPLIHHDTHAKNIAILKDWQLFFEEKDGYANRQEVMLDFSRFYHHLKDHEITISGKCLLGGLIYGDPRFKDGEEIFTSLITHFERVAKEYCRGVEHELICATTTNQHKYYFYADHYSDDMSNMLLDMAKFNKLSLIRGYYLPARLQYPNIDRHFI